MSNLRVVLTPYRAGIVAKSQVARWGCGWLTRIFDLLCCKTVATSLPHRLMGDLFADLGQMLTSVFGESGSRLSRPERKRIVKGCASALKRKLAR